MINELQEDLVDLIQALFEQKIFTAQLREQSLDACGPDKTLGSRCEQLLELQNCMANHRAFEICDVTNLIDLYQEEVDTSLTIADPLNEDGPVDRDNFRQ